MKKATLVAFSAVAAAFIMSGCGKQSSSTITMITEATFPPYEYLRGQEIVGIDVAICRAIAKELGKELVVEDAKFDAVIPSVISGKAELAAAGITVTEDRKKSVDFSIPYVTSGIVILSTKGNPYKTAEEVRGKKIGVQSGTTSDNYCVDDLKQEPERFDSPAAAVAALKAGKVDLVIADIDPAKNLEKSDPDIAITSDFLTKEEFAIAIAKGQPELLATINKVIQQLRDSGELKKIFDEYTADADKLVEAEGASETAAEEVDDSDEGAERAASEVEDVAFESEDSAEEPDAADAEELEDVAGEADEEVADEAAEVSE